jgi:stage II sporulation protein D
MKVISPILAAIFCAIPLCTLPLAARRNIRQPEVMQYVSYKNSPQDVRVLLTKFQNDSTCPTLCLEADTPLIIEYFDNNHKNVARIKGPLFLSSGYGGAYFSYGTAKKGRPRKKHHLSIARITTPNKHITVNGTPYNGTLIFEARDQSKCPMLINHVSLDEYIYSVLRYEIYQSWPMEMQKVQAIASRTYALHHILQARSRSKIYDVQSSNFHQRYDGTHEYEHLRQAVTDTKGVILTYNNHPALTMFDSCCGGIRPSDMKNSLFDKAPYLARDKQCAYCSKCSLFEWTKSYKPQDLLSIFKDDDECMKKLAGIGKLQKITVAETDDAGVAHTIDIKGSKKTVQFQSSHLLDLLRPSLRSMCFDIKEKRSRGKTVDLTFKGKGFGHLLGLCQHGARELVEQGWNYKNILKFYYPGTKLATLSEPKKATSKRSRIRHG